MLHFQKNNLTVFQSSLYKTTSAVIQSEKGIVLTDPTWLPHEIDEIKQYINEHRGDRQLYIIYTHSDFDHIIGAGAFPEAAVIASEEFQMNTEKEMILKKIHDFDQEYYIEREYVSEYPTVDRVIKGDGEKLILGDMTLTFYKAPGHTDDGLFTVVEPFGLLLSGDYLSDVEFPFITSSYLDYVKTVDKAQWIIDHHTINIHVPGHGNVTDNKKEIHDRIEFSESYLKRLIRGDSTLEQELKDTFRFYEGMRASHTKNYEHVKRETDA
ncbi:Glyoxylase, beta-lactamase superfamily II [Alkalibacterium subtropicum]|uniref:Glyoxylase, beta-lactamase superfamily II n=1 Tax=Alkalibacterium subtropicum TaxID=753702 RepID=A0A1I1IB83_9LACT|nr:MBL fold metallo-hydrolase [Alkalibacterium subtropicum]SFC33271.1 Glyoxylase, beta-lactamase superfamily II [Alkalibacterium subtropicum]